MKNNIEELPSNIHPIEKNKGLNRITKLFLLCALLTLVAMGAKKLNACIFFCSLADVFGVWAIVRSFRSDEYGI